MLDLPSSGERMEIAAESEAWFGWLESALTFTFDDPLGRFTARKKRRRGAGYWYAFRRRGGQLYETYLGKARAITLGRLRTGAARLNDLATWRKAASTIAAQAQWTTQHTQGTQGEHGNTLSLSDITWSSPAKLGAPPIRAPQIVRTHAVDRLDRATASALTIVSAPAGYGKTTLLAQWLAATHVRAVWISLDERDNDPVRFWNQVTAATELHAPDLFAAARAPAEAPSSHLASAIVPSIVGMLTLIPFPIMLVLDDYHTIENTVIHDAVSKLIDHLPPQAHLVLASRTTPPLPIAHLRAQRLLLELRASDLLFTQEEAGVFLTKLMQLNLTDEDVAILQSRTEGWIAGLQFAALSLQEHDDTHGWIARFGGENRYIFDYLIEQVVNRLTPDMQSFVLQTAVLDRLCGSLAEAVTHAGNSQARLAELERANLFLAPLDDRREWYRFHHLFRDALRRYMSQTQPALAPVLNARASAWCEAHGLALEAIDYAFAANALERAATLLEAYAPTALARGDVVLLRDRLEKLPEPLIGANPRLCVAHAFALYLDGERIRWRERVRDAEESYARTADQFDGADRAVLEGEILALRTTVRHHAAQSVPGELDALFHRSLGALPLNHAFRPLVTLFVGVNQLLDGNVRSASRALDAVVRASEARADVYFICMSMLYLGLNYLLQGRLDAALALCTRAEQYLVGYDDEDLAARAHLIRGKVFYERNDLERAHESLRLGNSLRYDPSAFLIEGYPTLAHVYLALGDGAAAQQAMEQGLAEWTSSVAEGRTLWGWTGRQIHAHQAHLWLLDGSVDDNRERASAWARALERDAQTPSPGVVAPPTYVHEWEYIVLARECLARRRAYDALAILDTLYDAAEAHGRIARLLEILVLQTVAYDALGDTLAALRLLQRAVELGAQQRFVRTFIDGGPAIHRLLMALHTQRAHPGVPPLRRRDITYLEGLLEAFALTGDDAALNSRRSRERSPIGLANQRAHHRAGESLAGTPGHTLTPRQRQIVRLVASGSSNADIAGELVISLYTVKRHVSNILLTLNVRSRTQAVDRARKLGLLDPEAQVGAQGYENASLVEQPDVIHKRD